VCELRIVKKKIHLLNNPSFRTARLFGPSLRFRRAWPAGILAPARGVFLLRYASCRSAPHELRQPVGSRPFFRLHFFLKERSKRSAFLRGMEDENPHSPFFGIPVLKRLSRVRTGNLPPSRETFNALRGTVVKSNFCVVISNRFPIAHAASTETHKQQNLMHI
jgi:hypothetical protein